MALLKISSPLISLRGKVGGCHFSRDSSGLHLSCNPRRTSSASSAQQTQRKIFSRCIAAYCDYAWTPSELQAWIDFGYRHMRKTAWTSSRKPTPQNLFVGYNAVRLRNGLSIQFEPPND